MRRVYISQNAFTEIVPYKQRANYAELPETCFIMISSPQITQKTNHWMSQSAQEREEILKFAYKSPSSNF